MPLLEQHNGNEKAFRRKQSVYCDFYSKGIFGLEDVPERFMGQEVGDLDGVLTVPAQGSSTCRKPNRRF